jgi:phosphomevalonate decarboxylase
LPSKATAVAHPMQGLIKYHGLRDERLRLPYHDSISVATAPLTTTTTVEFDDFDENDVMIDGRKVSGRPLERVVNVIEKVKSIASIEGNYRIVSRSDFASGIGLGASASGFAALATAACGAAGLKLGVRELSAVARLGAGSATRSVAGGFARWQAGAADEDSVAYSLAGPEELQMGIIVCIVKTIKQTEDAHREVLTSPLFQGRLSYLHTALAEMAWAIKSRKVEKIGELAERDTLVLHAITMTGKSGMILWKPDTLRIIDAVRKMREEGLHSYFSIDTGATVYINCPVDELREVEDRLGSLSIEMLRCSVGGASHIVKKHLF